MHAFNDECIHLGTYKLALGSIQLCNVHWPHNIPK